jgi:hypothetical protein
MSDLPHLPADQLQNRAACRDLSSAPSLPSLVDLVSDFGEGFATEMRLKTALEPKPLEALDVVDVFSSEGVFRFRGVVEEREGAHVVVRVGDSDTHKVAVETCRYADAALPPETLQEWEAARGADSSNPPL